MIYLLAGERKMEQLIVRVETDNGQVFYPRFEKNTDGRWTATDPSFQEINRRRKTTEKPAKKEKE
jgi:hypothetical protein